MSRFVALIRGINVGGKSLIKMPELKAALETAGFEDVSTYIQSGNVLFSSTQKDEQKLALNIEKVISDSFAVTTRVVVVSSAQLERIAATLPPKWGENTEWKYNVIFLLPPYDIKAIVQEIGELKPGIEVLTVGEGVLYQAVEFKSFGKSRTGKIASLPSYKSMTIRNHNTVNKLLTLLKATEK